MIRVLSDLRILILNASGSIGGAEERLIRIEEQFIRFGAKINVVWGGTRPPNGLPISYFFEGRSSSLFSKTPLRNSVCFLAGILTTRLNGFRFDMIYVARENTASLVTGFIASRLFGKPLVLLVHHLWGDDKFSLSNMIQRRGLSGLMSLATFFEIGKRLVYENADIVLCVSKSTADEFQVFRSKKTEVVWNGVDFEIDGLQRLDQNTNACFVGRVRPEKGISTLLRAWKMVTEKRHSANLTIVGEGSQNFMSTFQAEAKNLGVADKVTFTGRVSRSDLFNIIQTSKLFVLPSEQEGFSLATLEAMSAGLPCVLSDLPALREIYKDVAIFFPEGDYRKLAEIILDLLDNSQLRKSLSEKGKDLAKKYSWSAVALREYQLLSKLSRS